ncbi:hypothetical protein [Streptomyces rimosus]|uniref:hypothetical protein n=1 Tax=Streptomyces rimosus TaxID=1927 RepID=UPI0004CC597C|nr:hypothetical protein [Streptomyces rimosus]
MTSIVINDEALLQPHAAARLASHPPALEGALAVPVSGSARVVSGGPGAAYADFGITPYNTTADSTRTARMDPAALHVLSAGTSDANAGWRRSEITTTVPTAARYAEVRLRLPLLAQGAQVQAGSVMVTRHASVNLLPRNAAYHLTSCSYAGQACRTALSADRSLVGARSLKCEPTGTDTWAGPQPTAAALARLETTSNPLIVTGSVTNAAARPGELLAHFYDTDQKLLATMTAATFTTDGAWAWSSYQGIVSPPAGAIYAAVTPRLQTTDVFYCDAFGLRYQALRPTRPAQPYQAARHLTLDLRATRVNLARNPSFTKDAAGWLTYVPGTPDTAVSVGSSVGRTRPGAAVFSANATAPEAPPVGTRIGIGTTTGTQETATALEIVRPGRPHTLSVYVRDEPTSLPTRLYVEVTSDIPGQGLARTLLRSDTTTEVRQTHPEHTDGPWTRLHVTWTPPTGGHRWTTAWIGPEPESWRQGSSSSFAVDDLLLEEGPLREYFDGAGPGGSQHPDYLWEEWRTDEHARSHYYRERRTLQRRLAEMLADHIPLGTPYDLRYAAPPGNTEIGGER